MKKNMLPVIAALIIALLVVPAIPVNAAVVSTSGIASVVTIPEDDLKRDTGVMVLGLDPYAIPDVLTAITVARGWKTDSMCQVAVSDTLYPDGLLMVDVTATGEPIMPDPFDLVDGEYIVLYRLTTSTSCTKYYFVEPWPFANPVLPGMDLLSQHKILATLNGVPTKPDYVLCELVEKEKAKIPPMDTKTPAKRQFPDEIIKTTLQDVTSNFICKVNWIKPGVGALDVYFVGPRVSNFIADHMLIVTVGYKAGRTTIWASDLQDICILGWAMSLDPDSTDVLAISLFWNPGLSTFPGGYEYYWSWPDPIGQFVSCDEAAAWQLAYLTGGWPWAEN
jgi:hypothetical protein